MMGYGAGGMPMFGIVFMLLYVGAAVYFFVLLTRVAAALDRIAASLENRNNRTD
jgi:hypothetical protein